MQNIGLTYMPKLQNRRDELETLRDAQGKKLKALEIQLDSIPDVDIQGPSLRPTGI